MERPFFEDQFIVNDDDVHQHMKKVYDEMGSQVELYKCVSGPLLNVR